MRNSLLSIIIGLLLATLNLNSQELISLDALNKEGVFDEKYSGSSELADVMLKTKNRGDDMTLSDKNPFALKDPFGARADVDTLLDAQF